MLQTIRNAIDDLPNEDFGTYYQEYIKLSQDAIIRSDVTRTEAEINGIDDLNSIIASINRLSEDIKC